MGEAVIPFVFERWPERRGDPDKWPYQPPWWYLLEDITGKKFVNELKSVSNRDEYYEYLKTHPVSDDELKWRKWWKSESKGEHDVEQPRPIAVGRDI
jgi:hypothetical protein